VPAPSGPITILLLLGPEDGGTTILTNIGEYLLVHITRQNIPISENTAVRTSNLAKRKIFTIAEIRHAMTYLP
jgi:hypothetical protein